MSSLLSLTLTLSVTVLAWVFEAGPVASRSPYALAVDRITARVQADSDLAVRFDDRLRRRCRWPRLAWPLVCGAQQQRLGFELAQRGMARLDRTALSRRAVLLSDLLHAADERTCAALGQARRGAANFRQAFEALGQAAIEEWVELSVRAIAAELRDTPREAVSQEDVARAQREFLRTLSDHSVARLARVPDDDRVSDADACWIGRTLYTRLAAMPEPYRGILALHLAR